MMLQPRSAQVKISPSAIGYLSECPRCLWLHINENIKRPRGLFPSLPDGMDNIFKEYFDKYRALGKLPPEIEKEIDAKLFDNMEKLSVWREIDFGRGGLRAEFPEYGITLSGAIDDLLIAPDGKYVPLDFKTRGYPTKEDTHEHYQSQLDLYTLLFEKNNLPPAEFGYLLFFWPKVYENGKTNFGTELVEMKVSPQNGREILKKVQEIIKGSKPKAHENCEYCLYRESRNQGSQPSLFDRA